jgi:hypothetical protein
MRTREERDTEITGGERNRDHTRKKNLRLLGEREITVEGGLRN